MASLSRWLLWPLLVFWLVLAVVWGGIHGWIVPRIGHWRPWVEAQASQALGVPVRISAITATSEGLLPVFELSGMELIDPQGRAALRLPRVVITLSPSALWNLGAEQVLVDRPELDVRRTADGALWVAGLPLAKTGQGDNTAFTDWLLAQTEFYIRKGTVRWTDEMRGGEREGLTLELAQLDLVMKNGARRHGLRLDATPPAQWGQRFSLRAMFRQPLLSSRHNRWNEWDGQIFADLPQVSVAQLKQHADLDRLGVTVHQGQGALRLWGDVVRGELAGITADVALSAVNARLAPELVPLELEQVQGRLAARRLSRGFEVGTQGLQFHTSDGLRWPGGNAQVSYTDAEGRVPAQLNLRADRLDLTALSQIANRLPLGSATHAALQAYQPKGLVERIQVHVQGPLAHPEKYSANAKVADLFVAAQAAPSGAGTPGVRGLSAEIELTQAGGKARVTVQNGAIELPGVFEEPNIVLDQLAADAQWQVEGEQVVLSLGGVKFSNADAQGEFNAKWRSADPAKSTARARFPGVLDLQGSLSRADVTRVHRYLPLNLPETREYLRNALLAGQATGVRFKLKGDLADMPFTNPKSGEFSVSAQFQKGSLAYVPKYLQGKDERAWPTLAQLSGDFVLERNTLRLKGTSGVLQQSPALALSRGEVQITDLAQAPTLTVNTDLRGPVQDVFGFLSNSPVGGWLDHGLDAATGTGVADCKLRLTVPLAHADKTRVQGSVNFAGNDLHFTPTSPVLGKVRGQLQFSESGFTLGGVQARMLGGDARIEGGMRPVAAGSTEPGFLLRAQGTLTAEGLRAARELGVWSRLARDASGSAAYSATLGLRQGVVELNLQSGLQGLALGLPAPLNKPADSALPLRVETALLPGAARGGLQDRVSVELGRLASLSYVRDVSGKEARVLKGRIAVGLAPGEAGPEPEEGVGASVNLSAVDMGAWSALVTHAASGGEGALRSAGAVLSSGDPLLGYLPNVMVLRADELNYGAYQLNHVVVGGSRDGLTWRANLHADELEGYVEFRQPSATNAGRFHARLAQLKITPKNVQQVESLLEDQPTDIPALDVVVEEFELRGKALGRVEIDAVNRGGQPRSISAREWRLNKFNITNPQASFTATGNWAALGAAPSVDRATPVRGPERRRTVMNFKLDVHDAGELLARLGMKDVVRRGAGKLEGQVSWAGSPLSPDYPSLGGQVAVDVKNGQFLQVDPGAAKLLGVLSLQSLPRRLTLDFRDLFSAGFAFDVVHGDMQITNGIASTKNLQVKGVTGAALMEGQADIVRETQDLRVLVVPEINAGTASVLAGIANPVYGIISLVAQWVLRNPLIEANTREFHITGTWTNPTVTQVPHQSNKPVANPANPASGASAPTTSTTP